MDTGRVKFYVLNYDTYTGQIVPYNIFNNLRVYRDTLNLIYEFDEGNLSFDDFVRELLAVVWWNEKHQREYEIFVGDAFETNPNRFEKWSCYDQFKPNAEVFAHYLLGV